MITAIALLQFALTSIGLMSLNILVNSQTRIIHPLPKFVVENGFFIFLVPLLWVIFANAMQNLRQTKGGIQLAKVSGIVLSAAIVIFFMIAAERVHN